MKCQMMDDVPNNSLSLLNIRQKEIVSFKNMAQQYISTDNSRSSFSKATENDAG